MTTHFVQHNLAAFVGILQEFTTEAGCLVKRLAQKYNLAIDTKMPVNTFFNVKTQTQHGDIDAQWSYFLHGYECRFTHTNGHIIDVVLTFENEYGALNPFFLGRYIRTNPKHTTIGARIQHEFEDGLTIMEVLQENNLLLPISNHAAVLVEFESNKAVYVDQKFSGVKLKGG